MAKRILALVGYTVVALLLALAAFAVHLYFEGRPAQGRPQYVAMGSSFAAGPAISSAAEDSPWFCARSRDNYAHQLARLRGLSLVDVSCGGATTRHILEGGQLMQPAQIEAVTAETELVTITIGGNDIAYLGNMMALACNDQTPWYIRSIGGCHVRSPEETEQKLQPLLERLVAIITEVRRRAPHAQVVLVNYQTLLPESGSCERLGLSDEAAAQMRVMANQLAEVTYAAAEGHGALLLDAQRLTLGHDVCAPQPWANGLHPEKGLLGAPLHPTLEGMTAIAQGLNALLGERPR
ncbi:MAG TPA: SGNH/GDSL hydrolase family protein [Solimonas sp.]